ncbi:hypothetical protein EG329_004072 [Mollisiaceae sp. DMI_Dod_QoI]|nr:hypothetical protein EG329_004072 [Helotiales sp. DMI_Dod_QoI]
MGQVVMFHLLGLADELLLKIVEHVESKDDLSILALTCSKLQAFAEPFLYQSILIRRGTQALQLCYAIQRRPIRASSIHKLEIRYRYEDKEGMGALNQGLRKLCRLQELTIESPCCNDSHARFDDFASKGEIDYADYFTFASSIKLESQPRVQVPLQTFILHSHNDDGPGRNAFNMGKNAIIFLHPTLRNLTISCFDIREDLGLYLSATPKSTPLKSLTFDECNIAVTGLAAILSVPQSLERLILGERLHHLDETHPQAQLAWYPVSVLEALALQKDSLQYLKHIGKNNRIHENGIGTSMVEFSSLREMELSTHSIFTQILRKSRPPWWSTLPPNLQVLRLLRPSMPDTASFELEFLCSMLGWLHNIPQFDYVLDCYGWGSLSISNDLWRKESTRKNILDLVDDLSKQGVKRFKVFVIRGRGAIPPYMYGEEIPEEELSYDSVVPLVFGDIAMPQWTEESPDSDELSQGALSIPLEP